MKKVKGIYRKYRELINYLLVGGLTTVVSLGVYYVCVFTVLNPHNAIQLQIANLASWFLAVAVSFFLNKKFVFERRSHSTIKEVFYFYGARLFALVVDILCMYLFVIILRINDKLAKIIVQIIITVLNYVLSKFFVFKKQ